jgi:hypothetical protein
MTDAFASEVGVGEDFEARRAPMGSPVPPGEHPRLTCTAAELEWVKRSAESNPLAGAAMAGFVAEADAALAEPRPPSRWPKDDPAHWDNIVRAVALGYAALLTGDRAYTDAARQIVLHYADIFTSYGYDRESYLGSYSLPEAGYLSGMIEATDLLLAGDALSRAQRRHVIEDMLIPGVEGVMRDVRPNDAHHRCYNFQPLHCLAVGRLGFLLGEDRYVDFAMDDRRRDEPAENPTGVIRWGYGLRHLIAHDVRNDGVFWERSMSYHFDVLHAASQLAESALRNGIDAWSWQVLHNCDPGDHFCGNYPVDGDNGPKSLKFFLDGPLYYAFADLTKVGFGDSEQGPMDDYVHFYELGYARYGDPCYAWLLRRAYERLGQPRERCFPDPQDRSRVEQGLYPWGCHPWNMPERLGPGRAPLADGTFCATGQVRSGSRLFPSSGFAVLNHPAVRDGELPPETTTSLCVSFGPYGGAHGHPDKLSFALNRAGRRLVALSDLAEDGYSDPLHSTWTNETVSETTIVVDERSQRPARPWGRDSDTDPIIGQLETFCADGLAQLVRASCDSVYPGVQLDRTLLFVGGVLVDLYRVAAESSHQYDWTLYCPGEPHSSAPLETIGNVLGTGSGYQHLRNPRRVRPTGDALACTFAAKGQGLRVTLSADRAAEVILVDAPECAGYRQKGGTIPGLMVRRRGNNALFGSVLQPEADRRAVAIETRTGSGSVSARVSLDEETYAVAVSIDPGGPLTVAGQTLPAAAVVARLDDGTIAEASVAALHRPAPDLPSMPDGHSDGWLVRRQDGNLAWRQTWPPLPGVSSAYCPKTHDG